MNYSEDELHSKITMLQFFCNKHCRELNHFTKTLSIINNHTKEYINKLKDLKEQVINLDLDK